MNTWTRTSCLVLCCGAVLAVSGQAAACSILGPIEKYWEAGAATVRNFWLASLLVGGLILCLDVCQRRVSVPLLIAAGFHLLLGWLLYRASHWGYHMPSCEPALLLPVQLVLGLVSALLAYRVLRAIRSS